VWGKRNNFVVSGETTPTLAPWAIFIGEVGEKAIFLLIPFRLQITWRSMHPYGLGVRNFYEEGYV